MITLYDLVFDGDRRPSPFCWRTKLALRHKGLDWRDEPVGFTDKGKIAFADSKLVPVIQDGARVVKDSWAIAAYLDEAYPDKPLFPDDPAHAHARFLNAWADSSVHMAIFPLIVGDLVERVRPVDRAYMLESRGKRLGTTDFAGYQARARETGLAALRATLEPARRILAGQPFLSGQTPAYADYVLFGSLMWPRCVSPNDLLEAGDVIYTWRERMLDLFDGLGRKARGP